MLNGEGGSWQSLLTNAKVTIHVCEKFKKKITTNDYLRRRYFLLNCRPVTWITFTTSKNTGGDERVWKWLTEIKSWTVARQKTFLLLQNLLIARKYPHNSLLLSAACCLFESMSSNTLIPASINPVTSVNFDTVEAFFLGSGSGF